MHRVKLSTKMVAVWYVLTFLVGFVAGLLFFMWPVLDWLPLKDDEDDADELSG